MAGGAACLLAATSPFVRPVRSDPDDQVVKLKAIDPRAVSSVPTSAPLVALTFDDGPDPAYTPRVLEILAQHQVRATFFMIGRSAARHPELVAAVLTAGHTIANHTQDHLWLDRLDAADVQSQVEECRQTFDRLDVPANALFRPPRGLTSPTVASVTATLHERSYFWGTCLEANLSHHDVDTSAALCAERTHPGAIVLAHDGGHLDGPNPQSI
ncbi:MAG: polysaccharide deacetylase family protein, partial [Tetrasphaera sp.]|nr:polysaccharide deacetylase family protein [Tetrasphaera sp.]